MALKHTDLQRLKAAHLKNQMKQAPTPDRFGKGSAIVSRREQRELDRAKGLVPFAVKLPEDLVSRLRALADERKADLNDVVAEVLKKGLA